jgi:hypothetical protein
MCHWTTVQGATQSTSRGPCAVHTARSGCGKHAGETPHGEGILTSHTRMPKTTTTTLPRGLPRSGPGGRKNIQWVPGNFPQLFARPGLWSSHLAAQPVSVILPDVSFGLTRETPLGVPPVSAESQVIVHSRYGAWNAVHSRGV